MVFVIEIDSSSESDYPRVLPGVNRRLDSELDIKRIPWKRPSRGSYIATDPIQDAKVQNVTNREENNYSVKQVSRNRYQGYKPLWLMAEIWKCHIGRGEGTNVSPSLGKIIQGRGIQHYGNSDDDCGHIVGASLGGKMVDFNLFPQNQSLNRGWKGNYGIWRAIEACIKLWVTGIPEKFKPRVKFQMLLSYNDSNYPDRPDQFKYMVQFLLNKDSSSEEDDDDNERIFLSSTLFNIAKISLQCTNENTRSLKTQVKSMVAQMSDRCKSHVDVFLEELCAIIPEIETPEPTVLSSELYRHRPMSPWDFVPVIGSVKTIVEGCEDVVDGHPASAATNLILGSVSLGLDVLTLGTYSTVLGNFGKVIAKETAKGATRMATTKAIEKGSEAAVKTVTLYAVSSALKGATKL